MTRRHLPSLPLLLAAAALLTGLPLVFGAPGAPQVQGQDGARNPADLIKGKWQATVGGRPFVLDLRLDDGDLVGTVQLPNRNIVKIEDGIFVVDEFSFTTVEDDVDWEWSGTISESGMEGERERIDSDAHESFTAKRQP